MDALLFFAAVISIFILIIRLIIKLIKQKNIISTAKYIGLIFLLYSILWTIFYFKSTNKTVPLDTDICFDDWCATVKTYEKAEKIDTQIPNGQFFILTIKMTNKARGIAQKPSDPRIHIIDDKGNIWGTSTIGQNALEKLQGQQISLDQKLELHQSLETKLVFDVPKNAINLRVLIEEGPFITKLVLQSDKPVFKIQ